MCCADISGTRKRAGGAAASVPSLSSAGTWARRSGLRTTARSVRLLRAGRSASSSCADIRPIPYELGGREPDSWQHGLTLCLPEKEAAMARRTVVTELGPDCDAIRPEDRAAILFDIGLGTVQVDTCVRTAIGTIARLRAAAGRPFVTPEGTRIWSSRG